MNRGYVDALEHDGVADHFWQYELLLQFGVLYEILQLMFAEFGHARIVEELVFLFKSRIL